MASRTRIGMSRRRALGTTQKGLLGERDVASLSLLLAAEGVRLARPFVDDHGTDYIATRPPAPFAVSLQPKVATKRSKLSAYQYGFNLEHVPDNPHAFFGVCLYRAPGTDTLAPDIWWIPGAELKRGQAGRRRRTIDIHDSGRAGLRWSEFKRPLKDIGALTRQALEALKEGEL